MVPVPILLPQKYVRHQHFPKSMDTKICTFVNHHYLYSRFSLLALHVVQLSKGTAQKIKSVEQVKGPVVLDPMMAVPLKLLSVQSGVIASVLPINLEGLSVDLDLIIMIMLTKIKIMKIKMITMNTMIPKELLAMK